MKLTLIGHQPSFIKQLQENYFEEQGVESEYFEGQWHPESEAVLIIDPNFIVEEWVILSSLWKKWLVVHYPSVKLLVVSFRKQQGFSNYIDLANLPAQLIHSIEEATPLANMEMPLVHGLNLLGKFRKFLDGHGEESLLKLVTQLRSSFDTAIFMLDDGEDFEEAWESMLKVVGEMISEQLIVRWQAYQSYFKFTPFYQKLHHYEKGLFEPLQLFYKKNPTEELLRELTPQLSELSHYLREIDQLLKE